MLYKYSKVCVRKLIRIAVWQLLFKHFKAGDYVWIVVEFYVIHWISILKSEIYGRFSNENIISG